MIKNEVKDILH